MQTDLTLDEIESEVAKMPNPSYRLLVRVARRKGVTTGGIILPDVFKDKEFSYGKVIKLGQESFKREDFQSEWTKPNDWISFPAHSGGRVEYLDCTFVYLSDHHMYDVLTEKVKDHLFTKYNLE